MKIKQGKRKFAPITITLETREDASAFFGLVDKVDDYRCNANAELVISEQESSLLVRLSDAVTNRHVKIG